MEFSSSITINEEVSLLSTKQSCLIGYYSLEVQIASKQNVCKVVDA
jgi:hypothetical protein